MCHCIVYNFDLFETIYFVQPERGVVVPQKLNGSSTEDGMIHSYDVKKQDIILKGLEAIKDTEVCG